MTRNINIEFTGEHVKRGDIELVERKGIGHPDSICDGIAESVSRELSREYLKRFGRVLHHNTDQVELVGGEVNPVYNGGEVIKPIYILLSGRATTYVGKEKVPVHKIAINAAKKYLKGVKAMGDRPGCLSRRQLAESPLQLATIKLRSFPALLPDFGQRKQDRRPGNHK